VAHHDTHPTSPHPNPPRRVRRGPLRVHPRKDQRRWGQTYLRGLLLDGKRKSIEPMAARLTKGDPQADAYALEQALQQFVNQSPWGPTPVRRRLAERMTTALARCLGDR
jgi:SRSO17 transposase